MNSKPRYAEPGHQTFNVGVKALVVQDGQVLLLQRSDHPNWEVPGGRINEGENARRTLIRELHEELPGSTNVRVGGLVHAEETDFLLPNGKHLMLLFFRVTAKLLSPVTLSPEHTGACWVALEDLPAFSIQKPIRDAIRQALVVR